MFSSFLFGIYGHMILTFVSVDFPLGNDDDDDDDDNDDDEDVRDDENY